MATDKNKIGQQRRSKNKQISQNNFRQKLIRSELVFLDGDTNEYEAASRLLEPTEMLRRFIEAMRKTKKPRIYQ